MMEDINKMEIPIGRERNEVYQKERMWRESVINSEK